MMYKNSSVSYHAKKLVICFGSLLPLMLGAMEKTNIGSAETVEKTIKVGEFGNSMVCLKDVSTLNTTLGEYASLKINWRYGNPPTINVKRMGEYATIYNGVSNFKFYASCGVVFVVGLFCGRILSE